jgi:GTP cyclohydrolase I
MTNKIDKTKAIVGARLLMRGLGIDDNTENTKDTPARLVNALLQLCSGLRDDGELEKWASCTFPIGSYKGLIVEGPIQAYGLCSHHLFPISYEVYFGYLPGDRGIGFSKISNIICKLAAKPNTQEEFTEEIVSVFKELVNPKGVGVLVKGRHSCISTRKGQTCANVTSAVRGEFRKSAETRSEFFEIIKSL